MAPIPVPEENSAGFFLHLNFLGEQQSMSGPMEIGESILIQCLEPGFNTLIYIYQAFSYKSLPNSFYKSYDMKH